jgi:hypothetical protein
MAKSKTAGKPRPLKPSAKLQFVVDTAGNPIAVIIPIEDYEDLYDRALINEAKDEPAIPFEDLKRQLRAEGLL